MTKPRKRERKEPEYEPVLRQPPSPFPEETRAIGFEELTLLRNNNDLWKQIEFAVITALNQQALYEDTQSLTLDERIALMLMQIEQPAHLSFRCAQALAAVLTELLPRQGLVDMFIEKLQQSTFHEHVLQTYESWYLPPETR